MKYIYPAIFTPEGEKGYLVNFPDLENCFTDGDDLYEAMENAQDVLALILCDLEDHNQEIPPCTHSRGSKGYSGETIMRLVCCDTTDYRKKLAEERSGGSIREEQRNEG